MQKTDTTEKGLEAHITQYLCLIIYSHQSVPPNRMKVYHPTAG